MSVRIHLFLLSRLFNSFHGLPLGPLRKARRERLALDLAVALLDVPGQVLAVDVVAERARALFVPVEVPWLLEAGQPVVLLEVLVQRTLGRVLRVRMVGAAVDSRLYHA